MPLLRLSADTSASAFRRCQLPAQIAPAPADQRVLLDQESAGCRPSTGAGRVVPRHCATRRRWRSSPRRSTKNPLPGRIVWVTATERRVVHPSGFPRPVAVCKPRLEPRLVSRPRRLPRLPVDHRQPRGTWPSRTPCAPARRAAGALARCLPNAANSQSTCRHEECIIARAPLVGVVGPADRRRRRAGVVRYSSRRIASPKRNLSRARACHQPVRWRPTGGALGTAGEPTPYTWRRRGALTGKARASLWKSPAMRSGHHRHAPELFHGPWPTPDSDSGDARATTDVGCSWLRLTGVL
jgi:hypothetical protein